MVDADGEEAADACVLSTGDEGVFGEFEPIGPSVFSSVVKNLMGQTKVFIGGGRIVPLAGE